MLRAGKRGQTTLEVVILIGFVVAALIAMGVYMKRGIQGRLRSSTDQIGEQYSAGNTNSEYTTSVSLQQTENMTSGGAVTTVINKNEQSKTGNETVSAFSAED
ncbi:MAG: hypothetical protein PHN16_05920 [Candidatus Omnitrophica bacterium]|jgi:uncharacterized protein (UPF0333 family)|nr:hypothetical protein [Candidatus Omnitrophota bacterium]MDD3275270.1 hypothetical protein [Candidatus Omnitrophota bacterium]MDD4982244.1 hypothetical protein [Candidatus Omnitrophota bacterium]